MRSFVALLVGLAACYHDPDYGGTSFKCGPELGCPDGMRCIDGTCSGPHGPDGGIPDGGVSAHGIPCNGVTCAEGQECCVHFFDDGITCEAPNSPTVCDYTLACEQTGPNACAPGLGCCWHQNDGDAYCASACTQTTCMVEADCAGEAPYIHCCGSSSYTWKTCQKTCT
jgi:hypothetical protein